MTAWANDQLPHREGTSRPPRLPQASPPSRTVAAAEQSSPRMGGVTVGGGSLTSPKKQLLRQRKTLLENKHLESDTDSFDATEQRRLEFEQRRLWRRKQKRVTDTSEEESSPRPVQLGPHHDGGDVDDQGPMPPPPPPDAGQTVETTAGTVFIPHLNLDELWTDGGSDEDTGDREVVTVNVIYEKGQVGGRTRP